MHALTYFGMGKDGQRAYLNRQATEGDCHKESKIKDKREESCDNPSLNSRSLRFCDYFKDLE